MELQASYSDYMVSRAVVYWLYDAFQCGRQSAKLKGSPCAPYHARTEQLHNTCVTLLADDVSITLHESKNILQISYTCTQHLITRNLD